MVSVIIVGEVVDIWKGEYVRLAESRNRIVQLNSASLFKFFLLLLGVRYRPQKTEKKGEYNKKIGFHRLEKNGITTALPKVEIILIDKQRFGTRIDHIGDH